MLQLGGRMVSGYTIDRTKDGWWVVKSRRWLRWRNDDFMYSTRELAEDGLGDLLLEDARLTGRSWKVPEGGASTPLKTKSGYRDTE
jgi:hypothetical protein